MRDRITLVLGVDAKYIQQLEISIQTWKAFQPWLWDCRWAVFIDMDAPGIAERVYRLLVSQGVRNYQMVPWGNVVDYSSQREKMLSAFVHAPSIAVDTEWWMKLDCDAIALPGTAQPQFPDPEWFAPSPHVRVAGATVDHPSKSPPVLIGSPWHYTKPSGQMQALDDWAKSVEELQKFAPLEIPYNPDARTVSHPRYCSWLSFYNTDWSKWAASLCKPYRIPVDSQDGYHWYIAARSRSPVRLVKMKRYGWDNVSRLDALEKRVAALLEH